MHMLDRATFEEPSDLGAVDNEPLVIHRRSAKTHNQALIIFVHGLGGSRYGKKATWPGAVRKGRSVAVWAFSTVRTRTATPTR